MWPVQMCYMIMLNKVIIIIIIIMKVFFHDNACCTNLNWGNGLEMNVLSFTILAYVSKIKAQTKLALQVIVVIFHCVES